jgi:uncharacterized iron-regulated protein
VAPEPFVVPASVQVIDGRTGEPVAAGELMRQVRAADVVLLGEVHDNAVIHEIRGQLMRASGVKPAIVFEQFAETHEPIVRPLSGEPMEQWLDRNGFDREGWKWPLHQPVVDAALAVARSLWGSGLSRELLRSVVGTGEAAAPAHLRPLLEQAPLSTAARAALDRELVESHCGQLPESMIPGMRAAQTARDASMASALARAAADGPAWLIAGNGHVRSDLAVPRLLPAAVPGKSVLVVGFLERTESGGDPDAESRSLYDLVVVTPRVARPDPCASFRRDR